MDFDTMFQAYSQGAKPTDPQKLVFSGVDGFDVYNISAPFIDEGITYLAGRVEKRDSEDSHVVFFVQDDLTHYHASDKPTLHLQDPFVTKIAGELVVGGVHVTPQPDGTMKWRTDFYRGEHLSQLEWFLTGPEQMKDIRMAELPDGRILVLSRPQGGVADKGKIGMLIAPSLAAITAEQIAQAPLLKGNIVDGNWGGANEILKTDGDQALVLGHLARWKSEQKLQYTAMVFTVDLNLQQITAAQMIATHADFLPGATKRPELEDVIFSGGYEVATHRLYVGTGDAEAQSAEVLLKGL